MIDFIDKNTQLERFTHCISCEFFNLGICSKCGCIMLVKVTMPDAECPEGKWGSKKEENAEVAQG